MWTYDVLCPSSFHKPIVCCLILFRYALICQQCFSHNGMALKEEFEYIGKSLSEHMTPNTSRAFLCLRIRIFWNCNIFYFSIPLRILLFHEPGEKDPPPGTQTPRVQLRAPTPLWISRNAVFRCHRDARGQRRSWRYFIVLIKTL